MANLHAMITSVLGMFVLLAQLLLASLLWLPIALVSLAKQRKRAHSGHGKCTCLLLTLAV
jgi:hypothetical protein